MKIFEMIGDIGISEDIDSSLKASMKLTNKLSLGILLVLAMPLFIFTLSFYPTLLLLPVLITGICVLVFLLNKMEAHDLSRMLISIAPLVILRIYHSYLVPSAGDAITAWLLLEVSSVALPFIVFRKKDVNLLVFCTLFIFLIFVSFNITVSWFNFLHAPVKGPSATINGIMNVYAILICITGAGTLYYVSVIEENKNRKLNSLVLDKQLEIEKAEKKLVDTIEKVELAREDEERRKVEDNQRTWVAQGLATFSELLRNNNDDLKELSYSIISSLVKYLNAIQGGVYMIEEEDGTQFFEPAALYAYERRKLIEGRIELREGLLGACALEKESIFLTDIPDSYVRVTSGLGDANPTCLLIVPLKLEEEVHGVIELSSFKEFQPYQIDFVEKVGESIASTVASVKLNNATAKLLEESREQAKMLSQQEEEMRQNMEEMQATHEELSRQEALLKQKDEDQKKIIEQLKAENQEKINEVTSLKEEVEAQADIQKEKDDKAKKGMLNQMLKMEDVVLDSKRKGKALQQQAEEMKAQEEELRQNMEEMTAMKEQIEESSRIQQEKDKKTKDTMMKQLLKLEETLIDSRKKEKILNQQSEEMRAQDEELRQNLEEMQAMNEQIELNARAQKEKDKKNQSAMMKQLFKLEETLVEARRKEKALNQQSEEMRAQDEELRQNLEEMQAMNEQIELNARAQKEKDKKNKNAMMKQLFKLEETLIEARKKEKALKQQSEEMQAQEEELRQNLEEITALNENLDRITAEQKEKDAKTKKAMMNQMMKMEESVLKMRKKEKEMKRLSEEYNKKQQEIDLIKSDLDKAKKKLQENNLN